MNNRSHRAGFVVGSLSVFWLSRILVGDLIPVSVLVFMALLLLNTFFSIQCFSVVHPAITIRQKIVDGILIILYAVLIVVESNIVWFLYALLLLFIVATIKYVIGISDSPYRALLERKITINLVGSVAVIVTIMTSSFVGAEASMNVWTVLYAIVNIDLLWCRPLYRIPSTVSC